MAAIANARDLLLQAASPRILPVTIPIDKIEGLPDALKRIEITASAPAFTGASGTTTPSSITLTAELKQGLTGSVTWSVASGSATLTPSGAGNANCSVLGSSVAGISVTVRASVTQDGKTFTGVITLPRYGALAAADKVNLAMQVAGQLAMGSVTGYGALALLNKVSLNTDVVGALNGATQVTNLGTLAYASAIAAEQIGAGQLAAGVVYAGNIYASQIMAGSFTGKEFIGWTFTGTVFRTAASGQRAQMDVSGTNAHQLRIFGADGSETVRLGNSSRNYIRGSTGSSPLELLEISNDSGLAIKVRASNGEGLRILTLPGSGSRKPHIVLDAIPSSHPKPDLVMGGIAYHGAYGFIFCDGTGWFKPSAWSAV